MPFLARYLVTEVRTVTNTTLKGRVGKPAFDDVLNLTLWAFSGRGTGKCEMVRWRGHDPFQKGSMAHMGGASE